MPLNSLQVNNCQYFKRLPDTTVNKNILDNHFLYRSHLTPLGSYAILLLIKCQIRPISTQLKGTIMKFNEKEFFMEATLRICGSLEIEKILGDLFMYLRQFLPVDAAYLSHYILSQEATHVFAGVNIHGGRKMEDVITWTPNIKKFF